MSAPARQQSQRTAEPSKAEQAKSLLDQVLDNTSAKMAAVRDGLEARIAKIDESMPANLRGQAQRYVRRAMIQMGKVPKLAECAPDSFIKAVLEAAELGLAIDGRLAYAVPYWNSKRGCTEAQFQPSYLGLVAVARRVGVVKDCFARLVHQADRFEHAQRGGQCHLEHSWPTGNRGPVVAAYAIAKLPDGDWRYELMDLSELNAIRARSKAADKGPWVTDTGEMQKKTVLRRLLKMYSYDPDLSAALEISDQDYEEMADAARAPTPPPVGRFSLQQPQNHQSTDEDAPVPEPAEDPEKVEKEGRYLELLESIPGVRDEEASTELRAEISRNADWLGGQAVADLLGKLDAQDQASWRRSAAPRKANGRPAPQREPGEEG